MRFSVLPLICACAVAQTPPPNLPSLPPGMTLPPGMPMPNMDRLRTKRSKRKESEPARATPPGVPIPMDSAPMKSFQQLEQHSVYHMRMAMIGLDPQMEQMLAQLGMAPFETTVAGGTKQVVMRMKIPASDLPGQVDDWEFRSVSQNGRAARLISSPAVPRILARGDAHLAQQMAQLDRMAARTIAESLAQGPVGWAHAAMLSAETVAFNAEALALQKKAHDFFTWQCVPGAHQQPVDRSAPPPITDLKLAGDQALDGVAVTTYEFYVRDKDQFRGPMKMHVAKDTGLPMRIEMTDPQMRGGGMQMDYYDFDKGGNIEVPACLAKEK